MISKIHLKIALLWLALGVMPLPLASLQRDKPREVTAFDALDQIQTLIILDAAEKRPAEETLWLVKQIATLNSLQISLHDLPGDESNAPVALVDPNSFSDLRNSICKQRPHLRIVTADGHVKPCR